MIACKVEKETFEGKTIKTIDTSCVNVINFYFTDGTSIQLETVPVGHGIYGFAQQEIDSERSFQLKIS